MIKYLDRLGKDTKMANEEVVIGYQGKATHKGREITSPEIQDIKHYASSGPNETKQGDNVACAEVMCMGHPNNTSNIWVRTDVTATTSNAWPLGAGEVINFNVNNLSDLQVLIEVSGESLIVAYA